MAHGFELEPDLIPVETLVFMHVGASTDGGVLALEVYSDLLARGRTPIGALRFLLVERELPAKGPMIGVRDRLLTPPSS